MADTPPVLVACSHGTAVAAGRSTVGRLALAAAAERPELRVRQAFVDVQRPTVAEVVSGLVAQRRRCVVVPLLLSTGFHVRVDIGAAVTASEGWAVAGEPLGAGGALAPLLCDRLAAAGVAPTDAVVVTGAGSSAPDALADLRVVAAAVAASHPGPVTIAFVSPGESGVASATEAVAQCRSAGAARVAVATYLLAPGRFAARLSDSGADVVTPPLGLDPRVVARVLESYDAAAHTHSR